MRLYQSDHPDVPGTKDLHLFHFAVSNCSQRARHRAVASYRPA